MRRVTANCWVCALLMVGGCTRPAVDSKIEAAAIAAVAQANLMLGSSGSADNLQIDDLPNVKRKFEEAAAQAAPPPVAPPPPAFEIVKYQCERCVNPKDHKPTTGEMYLPLGKVAPATIICPQCRERRMHPIPE